MPKHCKQSTNPALEVSFRAIQVGFICLGLVACSSSPDSPPKAEAYADRVHALDLVLQKDVAVQSTARLEELLKYFQSIDDRENQWQVHYLLAQSADQAGQNNESGASSLAHAEAALNLAKSLASDAMLFQSYLRMGQLTGDQQYFSQALEFADEDRETALALVMSGHSEQAEEKIRSLAADEDPRLLGFLYYNLGKQMENMDYLDRARAEYQRGGSARGVIDSLFLRAQLEESQTEARRFAERALQASQAAELASQEAAIEAWLDRQEADIRRATH